MGKSMEISVQKKNGLQLRSLEDVLELAAALVKADAFIPDHFKKDKNKNYKSDDKVKSEIVAVILKGMELGLGPMASLQSMYIVRGKVGLSYDAIVGLLRREGYGIKWHKSDEFIADVELIHPDRTFFRLSYTIKQAEKALIIKKDTKGGETTPWYCHREAMLRARAITSAARAFAGVSLYCEDEIKEIERKGNIFDVVEVDENLSGTERLLETIEKTSRDVSEEDTEPEFPKYELGEKEKIKLDLEEAMNKKELLMCVEEITASTTLSEEEKKELRCVYKIKLSKL